MSGGSFEYVSAYYAGGGSYYLKTDKANMKYAGGLWAAVNEENLSQYVDTYDGNYSDEKPGDAVYETSASSSGTTSWDGEYSFAFSSNEPVFIRGGVYYNMSGTGVFHFVDDDGFTDSFGGFRGVLKIQ